MQTGSDFKNIVDFVNKVTKRCLYEMEYKQIGNLPKFYNVARSQRIVEEYNLFVWSGYTCQVKLLNDGLFLNIDACSKFIQKMTVLERLKDLLERRYSKKEISEMLTPKFDDS